MFEIFHRLRALRNIEHVTKDGKLVLHRHTRIRCAKGSRIELAGTFALGYFKRRSIEVPSYPRALLCLERGARLIVNGPVFAAPGVMIYVGEDATLVFGGSNSIGVNSRLTCNLRMEIGKNAHLASDVTLLDFDKNHAVTPAGERIRRLARPMKIWAGAVINMNVLIPGGVIIGDESIIGAGTVLRRDIPAQCLAYQNAETFVRKGYSSGLLDGSTETETRRTDGQS
jgi:acetyltransferase-like isoleucine patch superfamily enzyme